MKYLSFLFLFFVLIGCSSEQIEKSDSLASEPKIVEPKLDLTVGYTNINESSGEPASTRFSKKGTSVVVDGATIDVGTLGGTDSFIKQADHGFVVGGSQIKMDKKDMEGEDLSNIAVHAFLHKNGTIRDLGTLGGEYSQSSSVNSLGVVVGGSQKADKSYQAFKYVNSIISLPNLKGGKHSWAHSINDSFLIVGEAKDSSGTFKAVLWQDGEIKDLNSFLPADSGWVLNVAKSISNDGLVSGVGKLNGKKSFFKLNLNITK